MSYLKSLLGALCIALIPAGVRGAEPVKIRVSWIAPITNWAPMLLEKKELARHLGQSYALEPVRFVGTPQMITALANNELEIANLAFSTLPIAIQNAGLKDLRVIADELQDGVEGYYSQEYMVLAESPIKQVEDLKGKVVATVAAGSAVDVAIRTMLRRHGLEDRRDYTMVEAPLPTMRAMLAERKVDLIPVVLPFAVDPELRRIARPLFYNRDVVGVTQLLMWTARQSFIEKNRAAMVDFMEDTLRITRWFLDPANHGEVDGDRGPDHQAAAGSLRLGVHQARLLPRSQHAAEPRGAAKKCRDDEGSRLRHSRCGRERARRRQPRAGSSQAIEMSGTSGQVAAAMHVKACAGGPVRPALALTR